MKLHQLSICAFGPFPGTETVDFDALGADGLFLLQGRTGSGKTSVLDAITFALYGDVPGERDRSMLKSHHAPDTREPYVSLEFSLADQRYRIRRTPQHYRPHVHDAGQWRQVNQTVTLHRWNGDDFQPVSSGVQAANDEIGRAIGLTMQQFTKVILLPQGAFAQFLHANSREKQELLERLFDTDRFKAVEQHLRQQARETQAQAQEVAGEIHVLANTLRHDGSALLHHGGSTTALDQIAEHDLSVFVTDRAQEHRKGLVEAVDAASESLKSKAARAHELTLGRRQLSTYLAYLQRTIDHEAKRADSAAARLRLQRHEAALAATTWLDAAAEAQRRSQADLKTAEDITSHAQTVLDDQNEIAARPLLSQDAPGDDQALTAALEEIIGLRARLTAEDASSLEDRHATVSRYRTAAETNLAAAEDEAASLLTKQAIAEASLESKKASLEDLEELGAQRELTRAIHEQATERITQIHHRNTLSARTDELSALKDQEQQILQEAEARYRSVSGSYLRNIAAQLAETLREDEPCLVCGSAEHPHPFQPGQDQATREQVEQAQQQVNVATSRYESARAEHSSAGERFQEALEILGEHADTSLADGEALVVKAQAQHQEMTARRQAQLRLREAIDGEKITLATTAQALVAADHRAERERTRIEHLDAELRQLSVTLSELRGEHPSVHDRLAVLAGLESALTSARQALRVAQVAVQHAERAEESAHERLAASVFQTAAQCTDALLSEADHRELSAVVHDFDDAAQRLTFESSQQDVMAGRERDEAGESIPEEDVLDRAAEAEKEARRLLDLRAQELSTFDARHDSVRNCITSLGEALRRQEHLSAEQLRRAELAETINGGGPDNPMRMTLTTFVLAARLERVAHAATRHLVAMSEGRYRLLHDDGRRGRGQQGLDLKVHDEHSDEERPASSLSGGETFMASLSMALGLAEVVQSESAGLGMESLFIDEGFGSLDEETLESVMASLHRLQGEGRRVGVVSHVTQMHRQIPSQLQIIKHRTGSTLKVRTPQ